MFRRTRQTDPLIARRNVEAEPIPEESGPQQFDSPEAVALTDARLRHLESLHLPLKDRTVLDVGAGIGHLAQWFVDRGCRVTATEGRMANVERMRELYPDLDARVFDVESERFAELGLFDIVLCYGLLYHLENPVRALRNLAAVCSDLLLIETQICDSPLPVARLDDEYKSANQALRGIANKPSPAYIAMTLNRIGFENLYATAKPPRHPDYRFIPQGDLATQRDGHLLRGVYIASRGPIESVRLVPLLG